MRNYAILHIVADESRIFKTKERAPVMLCFEVYRPIEISLQKKPEFDEYSKASQIQIIAEDDKQFEYSRRSKKELSKTINV